MKKILISSAFVMLLAGCSGANVTSQVRDFDANSASKMMRCTTFATDSSSANEALAEYDGWTMIYTSEYTTDNKASTEMTVCFEKAKN